jgi:hypothetical protein
MDFIFKHFWILLIAGTIINGIVFWVRAQDYIAAAPQLKAGYVKLIGGWLVFGNIPWVVMGIGDLTGMTNGMHDYLEHRSTNPMVLAFDFSVVLLWVLCSNWIYLRGGADFLAKHPGLLRFNWIGRHEDITSPRSIKLFWALCLAGGILSMLMRWI